MNVGRCRCFHTTHFIGQSLIVTHGKPSFTGIGRAGLEHKVQLLNERFCQFRSCLFNDTVETAEVVSRLNDIIHINSFVSNADGVCLEDIPCLIVGQAATLNVVGVIGEINLDTVINAAFDLAVLLLLERGQQG